MDGVFEFAGGSVVGKDHIIIRRNNQDAFGWFTNPTMSVAVVCDGCGDLIDSPNSEVGAKVGVQLLLTAMRNQYRRIFWPGEIFLEEVRQEMLERMKMIIDQMGPNPNETIIRNFLFTVVGAFITPIRSIFFTLGDGIIIVNGEEFRIGPFPENQPPYLAYSFLNSSLIGKPNQLMFKIHRALPTRELENFLLGCDGVGCLIDAVEKDVPGREGEKVGPVGQFWEDSRYFTNSFNIQRRLTVISRDNSVIDWEGKRVKKSNGLLPDDTTFIVGRRKV